MGIIRNLIHITGITPEKELSSSNTSNTVVYSDIETIFIPKDKPSINSIIDIMINIEKKSNRIVEAPIGKIVILDGLKTFKIVYTSVEETHTANMVTIETPYNTFFEIPSKDYQDFHTTIQIIDAYFHPIDSRKIYCHIVYFINVHFNSELSTVFNKRSIKNISPTISSYQKDIVAATDLNVVDEVLITQKKENKSNIELIDLDSEYL